jgi:prephenate dehydrogenase
MKAIVLGCGLIGGLIAKADIDEGKLNKLTKGM